MYTINVFSANLSISWIRQLETIKPENCTIHYYTYLTFEDLHETLTKHLHTGDGALFSGQIPYFFAQSVFPNSDVPMDYFDVSERDFYRTLTELFYEKKIPLEQLAIDFCYEENGYLGIHEWSMGAQPHLFSQTMVAFSDRQILAQIYKWHVDLHKQNDVQLSLTRVAEMKEKLAEAGVPAVFLSPSLHAMQQTIDAFFNTLQLRRLKQNEVVVGHIFIPIDKSNLEELEYRQVALYKAILDFKATIEECLVHREAASLVVLTTYQQFVHITDDYTSCALMSFLAETLPFPVKIGWGIGRYLTESKQFAQEAASLCSAKTTQAFIIERGERIGPFLHGVPYALTTEKQQQLTTISEAYDIPLLQLQKIDGVIEKLGTTIMSAELVSGHLNMTIRSANRILKQLHEKGLALELPSNNSTSRGRPKKFYDIRLHDKKEHA